MVSSVLCTSRGQLIAGVGASSLPSGQTILPCESRTGLPRSLVLFWPFFFLKRKKKKKGQDIGVSMCNDSSSSNKDQSFY